MPHTFRIASPCSVSWDRMQGDDRFRHCSECSLNVYNFAAMTAEGIAQLRAQHEGRLCGRLYMRSDGTIVTRDCPVGLRVVSRRVSRVAGAALSAAMSVSFAVAQTPNSSVLPQVSQADDRGEIHLLVTDQTGAVIPNAKVLLENRLSSARSSGQTDQAGRVQFPNLTPGSYALIVSSNGFGTEGVFVTVAPHEITKTTLQLDVSSALMGVIIDSSAVELEPTSATLPNMDHIDVPDVSVPTKTPAAKKKKRFLVF